MKPIRVHVKRQLLLPLMLLAACGTAFILAPAAVAGNMPALTNAQAQEAAAPSPSSMIRAVGTVKSISGNAVTFTTDAGADMTINVQDSTKMLRTAPGQTDLKTASPIQLTELQVGDRILVRAKPSDDAKSIAALAIVVMKKTDIEEKQQRERDDWTKRGMGGIVSAVDAASGTIQLSTSGLSGSKTTTIRVSKDTIVRRYAPGSVKFDDATPGTLDQIQVGDQLRARGDRGADGTSLTADEIVSGGFRNVAGTVISADPAASTLTVTDLMTKKPVTVKVTPDTQLRQLPPMLAQGIAMRFRGGAAGTGAGAGTGNGAGTAGANGAANGGTGGQMPTPGNTGAGSTQAGGSAAGSGGRPGGMRAGGDFQQMLSRLPAASLGDLKKGDVVMMVATQGAAGTNPTAITLLSGVDAILAASTGTQQAMLLAPWNLSSSMPDSQ
jgi:Domain of unknown function (DUF5666)